MTELTTIEVDGELIDHRVEVDEAYVCQREVKELYDTVNKVFLGLAERFWKIQKRKWFIIYGYETFDEYIVSESYSRAWVFQLAKIHDKYVIELGVDDKRLSHIGVTKLVSMSSHINKSNKKRLLDVADEATVIDLKRELQIIPEIGEGNQSVIDSGYYYLSKAHGDIAGELVRVSKRFIEVFEDGSGALIAKV